MTIGYTQIYTKQNPELIHTDNKTKCTHGLGIPGGQWHTIPLPLKCLAQREVHPKLTPMWIDDIPISEPVMKLNCPCGKPATWILIYGCETNHHIWEEHLCKACLTTKTAFPVGHPIRNKIYTAHIPWTCMNVILHDINGEAAKQIECTVTRWYARELTPDMTKKILDEKLTQMRNQK